MDHGVGCVILQPNDLEKSAVEGESPVGELRSPPSEFPSTARHVKPCRNMRRPLRKAKYYLVTDSEPVPRGKGEKNPGRGVKKILKLYAYKKSEPVKG